MHSIARSMEVWIEGQEALLSLKMNIEIEKKKTTKISNLKHAKDLGAITEEEFKSQIRAILGLGSDAATACD